MKWETDPLYKQWIALDEFVKSNWAALYYGAQLASTEGAEHVYTCSEDYWAPQRAQIRDTRLHRGQGLKIAAGHHRGLDVLVSEAALAQAASDIEELLSYARKGRRTTLQIKIIDPTTDQ